MLRRYLILNGVSSAVLYLAVWAYVPSPSSVSRAVSSSFESYVMEHAFLGPILNRMILVGADVAAIFH